MILICTGNKELYICRVYIQFDMDNITQYVNNMTDDEKDALPLYQINDAIYRYLGNVVAGDGQHLYAFLDNDHRRNIIYIPFDPPAEVNAVHNPDVFNEDEVNAAHDELLAARRRKRAEYVAALSPPSRAARESRKARHAAENISRRAAHRAAIAAYEAQQINPHNIFQQQAPLQRPRSPVRQQPADPNSRRRRKMLSRDQRIESRRERQRLVNEGRIFGGKTRRLRHKA